MTTNRTAIIKIIMASPIWVRVRMALLYTWLRETFVKYRPVDWSLKKWQLMWYVGESMSVFHSWTFSIGIVKPITAPQLGQVLTPRVDFKGFTLDIVVMFGNGFQIGWRTPSHVRFVTVFPAVLFRLSI